MRIKTPHTIFKRGSAAALLALLSACSLVNYRPVATISKVDTTQGYRLEQSIAQ